MRMASPKRKISRLQAGAALIMVVVAVAIAYWFLTRASDVTLYVRVAGNPESGNVLIAISGGPGLSSNYMLDLEQFAGPQFAVVTYDQRGTGNSTTPPLEASHFSLDKYAEDLEAVRQKVGVEQVHLLGHSFGGLVAMYYATLHPERVRSLLLISSAPPTWQGVAASFPRIEARIQQLEEAGMTRQEA